jgi:hypothetical protein
MMNTFYKDIQGWCNFHHFYADMALRLPDNGTFVEVGVWAGRSLIYFLSCLQKLNKTANVYAVDTFEGTDTEPRQKELIKENFGGDIYGHFLENLNKSGFEGKVNIIKLRSVQAAELFADNSVDICFLDGDHAYDGISSDILAWNRKTKGIISGHDFDHPPVERAVREVFDEAYEIRYAEDHVWFVEKGNM